MNFDFLFVCLFCFSVQLLRYLEKDRQQQRRNNADSCREDEAADGEDLTEANTQTTWSTSIALFSLTKTETM